MTRLSKQTARRDPVIDHTRIFFIIRTVPADVGRCIYVRHLRGDIRRSGRVQLAQRFLIGKIKRIVYNGDGLLSHKSFLRERKCRSRIYTTDTYTHCKYIISSFVVRHRIMSNDIPIIICTTVICDVRSLLD